MGTKGLVLLAWSSMFHLSGNSFLNRYFKGCGNCFVKQDFDFLIIFMHLI